MIAQGDAAAIPLPDKSIHCVVTSPPYWGLRKYAGEQGRIWGGDPECEHEWIDRRYYTMRGASSETSEAFSEAGKGNSERLKNARWRNDSICEECGAWYGSLGLEPTPEQHVENIVEICREVRRVLRDDGVFWLNYGDCYASSPPGTLQKTWGDGSYARKQTRFESEGHVKDKRRTQLGIAQGSLMMMPHRVALALQQDGWIVRQDLVWFKRNPMPESVNGWRWQRERTKIRSQAPASDAGQYAAGSGNPRARPGSGGVTGKMPPEFQTEYEYGDDLELKRGSWRHTRAHEYVFMLVKGMQYFSNQEAVREVTGNEASWDDYASADGHGMPSGTLEGGVNVGFGAKKDALTHPAGRNPRSVLDVPTAPYKGAHYATFPPNLIAPLIRATCPRWACPVCGRGWAGVVEHGKSNRVPDATRALAMGHSDSGPTAVMRAGDGRPASVLGYRPTCEHPHTQEEAVPGICFDPFVGSGTTVKVAQDLLRHGIGIDVSMEYLDLQAKLRTGIGSPSNQFDNLPLFE